MRDKGLGRARKFRGYRPIEGGEERELGGRIFR
jgi:hypothetical protein